MHAVWIGCSVPHLTPYSSQQSKSFSETSHSWRTTQFHRSPVILSRCCSVFHRRREQHFFPNPRIGLSRRRFAKIRAAKADYYATLKVSRSATLEEIKKSDKTLARKHLPDKTPGSEEKFKEISAAYEVLSNEEKRAIYDRYGKAGLQGEYDASGFGSQDEEERFPGKICLQGEILSCQVGVICASKRKSHGTAFLSIANEPSHFVLLDQG